jgi:hypothetical protein
MAPLQSSLLAALSLVLCACAGPGRPRAAYDGSDAATLIVFVAAGEDESKRSEPRVYADRQFLGTLGKQRVLSLTLPPGSLPLRSELPTTNPLPLECGAGTTTFVQLHLHPRRMRLAKVAETDSTVDIRRIEDTSPYLEVVDPDDAAQVMREPPRVPR